VLFIGAAGGLKGQSTMSYVIEYLASNNVQAGASKVVEKIASFAQSQCGAERSARAGVKRVQQVRAKTPVNGFQIRDQGGKIVLSVIEAPASAPLQSDSIATAMAR
jgi:hypothetical protein